MKRIAVFAGSFDPFTLAHLDIVRKASAMFDSLVVLVGVNRKKRPFLPVEKRVRLIAETLRDFPHVSVDSFDGLTVDYLKKMSARFLVRGIRSAAEFDAELHLAWNNRSLHPEAETVFFPVSPEYAAISSSAVREILSFGGDVSKMLPESIYRNISPGDMPDVRSETL